MSQTQTHVEPSDGSDHKEVHKKVKSRRPASELRPFHPALRRNGMEVHGADAHFCDLQTLLSGSRD